MNYEKKYKDALANARQEYNTTENVERKQWLEELFPELAESKDERIRKELLESFKYQQRESRTDKEWFNGIKLSEVVAWIEKQGESIKIKKGKNYLCTKTHKYAGVEWIEGVKYYSPEDYSLVNQGCTCYCPKYSKEEHNNFFKEVEYDGCLEKQGELKETPCDKCKKGLPSHSCQDITALGRCYIENINTSNKVDPKFHEGDWVVYKNDVCQIVKREEGCNKLVTTFGIEKELVNERNLSSARLWTIQDAKDGDVLACENGWTCIFNCLNDNLFSSHCFMDNEGWFCEDGGQGHTLDERICGEIHPATKEQRDLLFQKMKEAGYEWDANKKELKKFHVIDEGKAEMDYCFTKMMNGEKVSSAWSEEDEKIIRRIDSLLYAIHESEFEDIHAWLKSLKDRVQPQNRWKPSKEQIIALRWILNNIPYNKHKEEINGLLDQIKDGNYRSNPI